jgi:hypothetical protein
MVLVIIAVSFADFVAVATLAPLRSLGATLRARLAGFARLALAAAIFTDFVALAWLVGHGLMQTFSHFSPLLPFDPLLSLDPLEPPLPDLPDLPSDPFEPPSQM